MARLSKSQQERQSRLKALMHQVPEDTDISKLIFGFMGSGANMMPSPSADRHAAIACAAAVEHGLKSAIGLYLADDADRKSLFEDFEGPLGSFSSRTKIARALGVIDDAKVSDIDIIRRVRNTFAHSVLPISFGQQDLSQLVDEIYILSEPTWDLFHDQYKKARERYILSCAIHFIELRSHKVRPRVDPISHALSLAEALQTSQQTLPQSLSPQSRSAGLGFGRISPPATKPEG